MINLLDFAAHENIHFSIPLDRLSAEEVNTYMQASDNMVKDAYSRMSFSKNHRWLNHTDCETDFIVKECALALGDTLLDFGCGQGRHSLALASKGYTVYGIDYIEQNIEAANNEKQACRLTNVQFHVGDCRNPSDLPICSAAICLYDVIGTFTDDEDNLAVLKNIADHLQDNGTLLLSVMNYEMTISRAENKFVLSEDAQPLLRLKASNTMETTGDIFDPNYYLVDTATQIVYRKEQFSKGNRLPVEMFVRDKRYTADGISSLCKRAGFLVDFARFVNASDWNTALSATDPKAKEILLKCRKCSDPVTMTDSFSV